jgi:hypothetical protein
MSKLPLLFITNNHISTYLIAIAAIGATSVDVTALMITTSEAVASTATGWELLDWRGNDHSNEGKKSRNGEEAHWSKV